MARTCGSSVPSIAAIEGGADHRRGPWYSTSGKIGGSARRRLALRCAYCSQMRVLYFQTCSAVPGSEYDLCSSSTCAKPGRPLLSCTRNSLSLRLARRRSSTKLPATGSGSVSASELDIHGSSRERNTAATRFRLAKIALQIKSCERA